tara:strand:- start:2850 stop:3809 length:960 start_codon:yes stop_codon:yes gene_type:complete
MKNKFSLIIGGSGFIGQHLINQMKSNYLNLDITESKNNYKYCDVKNTIDVELKNTIDIIYNLAAIHTTPGHQFEEYFETNIKGAENVCNFARKHNINTIVFSSSIAPYGTWEDEKNEASLPLPTSAYGMSKLVAEEIHKRWQSEKSTERKLIIVRPGVVFGKNERGNFTRLYHALKNNRFLYPGRKDTKKAAIYVKDLVRIMMEMTKKEKQGISIYNMTYTPCYTIEEICKSISKVTSVKEPRLIIPANILKITASFFNIISKLIGKQFHDIHPDRVKKLMTSTNISGKKLLDNDYNLYFTLEDALYDWYKDNNLNELL